MKDTEHENMRNEDQCSASHSNLILLLTAENCVMLILSPELALISSVFDQVMSLVRRSWWPRGLGRGSTATRLLGLRVRNPPRAWVSVVSVVCCQVEVSATS